jgi:hypothetical protein
LVNPTGDSKSNVVSKLTGMACVQPVCMQDEFIATQLQHYDYSTPTSFVNPYLRLQNSDAKMQQNMNNKVRLWREPTFDFEYMAFNKHLGFAALKI